MARREWLAALSLLVAGCEAPGYSPYPLDFTEELPADAFARCRAVLLSQYGALTQADAAAFRFATAWQPVSDPVGERRALVFRDSTRADSLSIVVELRWLTVPLVGVPHWTTARGDHRAERQLAELLRESLQDPDVQGLEDLGAAAPPEPGAGR